jgi:SAM-dependent methyltransferase
MTFWDSAFSGPGYKYGTAPNAFLASEAWRFSPASRVLVPGDGEGRNGVWLAEQGHRVTTVDNSAVGVAKARALAELRGTTITALERDLEQWTPARESFEVVVSIYLHLPPTLRVRVHRGLAAAVAPGGWLLVEAFHPLQLGRPSGGPRDVSMLFTLADLRADLAEASLGLFREEVACEQAVVLDEGPGHQGPAQVTRYLVQRQ